MSKGSPDEQCSNVAFSFGGRSRAIVTKQRLSSWILFCSGLTEF